MQVRIIQSAVTCDSRLCFTGTISYTYDPHLTSPAPYELLPPKPSEQYLSVTQRERSFPLAGLV